MQVPLVMCLHADVRLDLTLGMHRGNDGDLPNGFVCTDVSVELCVGSINQSTGYYCSATTNEVASLHCRGACQSARRSD
jgi:hypothetical protein